LRIGIAYDLLPADCGSEGPDDRYEEFDKPETVEAIAEVLRGEGYATQLLGDGRELLTKVLADPPDFVWNLAEGEGVGRSREARVPAALEMLGIPYSGSDPLTLAVALDKGLTRHVLKGALEIPLPAGVVIPPGIGSDDELSAYLDPLLESYPLILKPAFEGSSKGIRAHCVVENENDARSVWRQLASDYGQPILVEEFIDGDEVTVGLIGNAENADVLGVMRVLPKERRPRFVYSLEVKRDWARQVDYDAPAHLPESVLDRLTGVARSIYQTLGCRDVSRLDFRVRDGVPYFLEVNPLPGLNPVTSDLVILARGYGIEYPELIRRILTAALGRVELSYADPVAP
jgi:D-alanine-D-alanine ligase